MKKGNSSVEPFGTTSLHIVDGDSYNAGDAEKNNIIGKQIESRRVQLGLSRADLRLRVSSYGLTLHRDVVRRWEIGQVIPSGYQLIALCHALDIDDGFSFFGGLPLQLNDVGQRKLEDYKRDLIATGLYAPAPIAEIEYIDMPISYLAASAGTGAFLDEGNYEYVSVPKSSVPAGAELGIRVSGDSMEPVYSDGQLVWVKLTRELFPGDVGIFTLNGEGFIKAFALQEPSEELRDAFTGMDGIVRPQPVLKSYNKKYNPICITPDAHFEIVAKVLR
jgi:phage repressor protein C with HTH and peptisase S24 domain